MDSPFGALRLAQDREHSPQWVRHPRMQWRYAYARAAETRAQGEVGQDVIVLDGRPERLNFALADGVSQSFYGDLAASALGDGLVGWLGQLAPGQTSEQVSLGLAGLLEKLRVEVTEDVDVFPLPKDLPPMLLEVLNQKRQLGSESMFVCGSIWLDPGKLLLCWLGDIRCRLWRDGREEKLEGLFRTQDRWSSRRGPVAGPPQLHFAPLQGLSRLMIYSDGLASLDALPDPPTDEALQAAIDAAGRSPTSDDISFLDIVFS